MERRHVALVTGGGRGIGRAIALRVARAGAAVFVAARSQEACIAVVDEIVDGGGTAWPLYLDVADFSMFDEALAEARELAGGIGAIDWLVNNAGIAVSAPFLQHGRAGGEDLYAKHLDVNFHGPRRLIEALVPGMIERKYGRVVNVASSAGLHGHAYVAAYCASKHALVGYSVSAAKELAKTGVTMNLVCPHYVDSPMTDASVERIVAKTKRSEAETRALLAAQNPGGALVTGDEVADAVLALLQGDQNGAVAELVGARMGVNEGEAVRWR
ncbi:MAG: SDR family oxidoreductase [Planctomycetes bacterium]|nr:SDR family oxidoreductase [Planctomycetota bacterium]